MSYGAHQKNKIILMPNLYGAGTLSKSLWTTETPNLKCSHFDISRVELTPIYENISRSDYSIFDI